MLAVDTNVVVRLLVADDERQAAQARHIFEADEVWIGITVLLETFWVLTGVYGMTEAAAGACLRRLLGLPNVHVQDATIVATAPSPRPVASSGRFAPCSAAGRRATDRPHADFAFFPCQCPFRVRFVAHSTRRASDSRMETLSCTGLVRRHEKFTHFRDLSYCAAAIRAYRG